MATNMDFTSEELSLIDCGIQTLHNVPLKQHLKVLNLHCNHISQIENLMPLRHLQHLDLSSNQIKIMEGLGGLLSLKTLNLACNLIKQISGLENLRSLTKLNLSYNQIEDLFGLRSMQGSQYKLSHLELHGNQVASVQHVVDCVRGCSGLRQLTFESGGVDNPVCQQHGYRSTVLNTLPRLEVLDGLDRQGASTLADETMTDLPGLEQYMDYLQSNSSSDVNPLSLATPKIDSALEAFRKRGVSTPEYSNSTLTQSEDITQGGAKSESSFVSSVCTSKVENEHEDRLRSLEKQLAELLSKKLDTGSKKSDNIASSKKVKKLMAKRDVDDTDESSEADVRPGSSGATPKRAGRVRNPNILKSPTGNKRGSRIDGALTKKNVGVKDKVRQEEELVVRGRSASPPTRSSAKGKRNNLASARVLSPTRDPTAYASNDKQQREDVQQTYVQLMGELESERERRWKAEAATKKLVEHIKELRSRASEEHGLNEVSGQVVDKLKQTLANERETRTRVFAEVEVIKEQLNEAKSKLHQSQAAEEKIRSTLRALEDNATQQEREYLQNQAQQTKKVQESQLRVAACQREIDLLRSQVKSLKQQIQQTQELLATREQQHKQEMEGRYSMDSKEFQEMLEREVSKAERLHSKELKMQQEKIDTLSTQYTELEDEFRMALQIEADRFNKIEREYERLLDESTRNKQALESAQKRDEKATGIISELTSVVKEQKGRITELSKSKTEQNVDSKERIQTLEAHLEEARRRMIQLELVKQDKSKLQSQVQAQESVIEGLKAERKLWSEELAQQGSSLAQDRGRLESKIEALKSEVHTLKKQLDRETDTVRIKTKLIEDQTETTRQLKDGLLERDNEIRKLREQLLKVQRDCEEQVASEVSATEEVQTKYERLRERKEELKEKVESLEDQLEESKNAHSILNRKWKDKSSVIGQLEKQVREMKNIFEAKEAQLLEEKERAINAASVAVDKLRNMDDAFRKQLDAKELKHSQELEKITYEKQEEADAANKRVIEVEEEMRSLLKETEHTKRSMEDRVKKLTRALGELQQDLF